MLTLTRAGQLGYPYEFNKHSKGNSYTPRAWGWDPEYDFAAHMEAFEKATRSAIGADGKAKGRVRRAIDHPNFMNVNYHDAEKKIRSMAVGEAIVRPSSKGSDNLTISWKLCDNYTVHIDVKEEDKDPNALLAVGSKLLIGTQEFESIDEILATWVGPCSDFAGMLMAQDFFRSMTSSEVMELLKKEKAENPKPQPTAPKKSPTEHS